MKKLRVDKTKQYLTLDDKPFFYLADTVWSAFTNIQSDEWIYYLQKRREQGFTVLQINVLPQWDRCLVPAKELPFPSDDGRVYQYNKINDRYFEHARQMCEQAAAYGFQVALVLLWSNFVPGTWAAKISAVNQMPREFVKRYIRKVYETFDDLDPIYIVSGDTDFDTAEAISYYQLALDTICTLSPHTLKTMHIKGRYSVLPAEFISKLDFYLYQSGHDPRCLDAPYRLAEEFRQKYPLKPLINGEPCYEQMGYSEGKHGRFARSEVRRAGWLSILAGASAGIAYGAHGLWNWNKPGLPQNPTTGEAFFDTPLLAQEALQLPGAGDFGYIRAIFELFHITTLQPSRKLLTDREDVRMAEADEGKLYLIYSAVNTKIALDFDCSQAKIRAIDLSSGQVNYPGISTAAGKSTIGLRFFQGDELLIIQFDNL